MNRLQACLRIAAAALLAASCTTTPPPDQPLSEADKEALMTRARPAAAYGLGVRLTDRGAVLTGANRVFGAALDQLPMEGKAGPVVRLQPNAKVEFDALLDSSSPDSWVDPVTAARTGFRLVAGPLEVLPAHVWDPTPAWRGLLPSLRVGKIRISNAAVGLRMEYGSLGQLGRDLPFAQQGGAVLGVDFLRPFSFVQIDCAQGRVVFGATARFKPIPEALMAELPLGELDGALGCRGKLDGQETDFILDIAGDFELATHAALASPVRQITLGDLVLRNVNVSSAYALQLGHLNQPRLGRRLLSRYRVTFDFAAGRVCFERP